jgi:hypothetical protein
MVLLAAEIYRRRLLLFAVTHPSTSFLLLLRHDRRPADGGRDCFTGITGICSDNKG